MIICPQNWAFFKIQKICPDKIFNPVKEDMFRKNQTYGNPNKSKF